MRGSSQESSTPYCRCRVLYLGSAVPHASKEGLLGVQEPLRELYPEQGALGARGIDSWLSVWSNGLLLENVDEHRKKVTRFFPIESLHYCAAVRHVKAGSGPDAAAATRFFPLDSPFARTPSANHPPLFAAVLRRTTGIKVLECHAFICKRDMAANALVRCCFHAYADSRFAKGLEPPPNTTNNNNNNTAGDSSNGSSPTTNNNNNNNHNTDHHYQHHQSTGSLYHTLGGSSTTLAEAQNHNHQNGGLKLVDNSNDDDDAGSLVYNGDENHKVWARGRDELDGLYQEQGTLRSARGSRLRQMIAPPPPPPPPPPSQPLMGPEEARGNSSKKPAKNKLQKRSKRQEEQQQQQQQQPVYANGHGPHHHHHHHHTLGHPARQGPGYHHQSRSVAGTLARPAPILLVPAATLPRKLHHHHPHPHHPHHPHHPPPPPHRAIRPTAAAAAAAPIVPLYAPLPLVPPVPPAVIYGYGTTGNRGNNRRHNLHLMEQQQQLEYGSSLGLHQSRRMAASHADLSSMNGPVAAQQQLERASPDSPDNNNESRFGTGIYRRKGHLNERAFSYSIRAEHRARSHGSLASLGFAGQQQQQQQQQQLQPQPQPLQQQHHSNGIGPAKEEKKDREMAHLIGGLSLDDGQRNGNYHPHPQPLPRPKAR